MSDRAYALVQNERLLRVSFSKSLLEHMRSKVPESEVRRVRLVLGRTLAPGQPTDSRLFAVCKASTGWPLRVTAFRELAEQWRHPTRDVLECWLAP